MTTNKAKRIIREELDRRGLQYDKLTAKRVSFSDLLRGSYIFVRVHGWVPNAQYADLLKIAIDNGFRLEARR